MKRLANNADQSAFEQADIQDVLQVYETALNASDADTALTLFTPDSVFMAPNAPSTIGVDAIRTAYDALFQAISFETELHVEEVVQVAPNWAFVRTNSTGFVTVHAIKQRFSDANHELFIFNKGDDDQWKIARYSFSSTNQPK